MNFFNDKKLVKRSEYNKNKPKQINRQDESVDEIQKLREKLNQKQKQKVTNNGN